MYAPERKQVLWQARRTKIRKNADGSTSKVPAVFYLCAVCGDEFKQGEVAVDHVTPVGRTPEFPSQPGHTWDDWLRRLFCAEGNLQVICKECHAVKTRDDNERTRRGA